MPNTFICKALPSLFMVSLIAMVGSIFGQTPSDLASTALDSITRSDWIGGLKPSLGSTKAPIQVVCFLDYQCPICRKVDPLIRKAIAKRTDIALTYREFPLNMHQFAKSAAIVAENARASGKFELVHRLIMQGQALTDGTVKSAARTAHVSTNATVKTNQRLDADNQIEQKAKINSVPAFVVISHGKTQMMGSTQFLEFLK